MKLLKEQKQWILCNISPKGSSINDVTAIGVGRNYGFCDDNNKVLFLKRRWGQNMFKIAWRHLRMTPSVFQLKLVNSLQWCNVVTVMVLWSDNQKCVFNIKSNIYGCIFEYLVHVFGCNVIMPKGRNIFGQTWSRIKNAKNVI